MPRKITKIIAILLSFSFLFQQSGFSQVAGQLDILTHLASLHSSLSGPQDKFRPLHLRYLDYEVSSNNFKILLDKGDTKDLKEELIKEQTRLLMNYFQIGLTLPNDSFWVNLRPDSPDNIIDPFLERTDLGKVLLEADLQLKRDTAKATSPQTPEGKLYWDKLYKKAGELFGTDNVTIPTLVRPWIVPGEIIIRETPTNAYIYKATLKVMLEEDYLKGSATYSFKDPREKLLNQYSSQLIKESIIPKLTKEINTSKRYAPLRQVYYSLILAQWFKAKQGLSRIPGTVPNRIDSRDLTNLTSAKSWSKNTYFNQYQKSFKEGEYNLKEQAYSGFGQVIRTYTSGGIVIDIGKSYQGSSPLTTITGSNTRSWWKGTAALIPVAVLLGLGASQINIAQDVQDTTRVERTVADTTQKTIALKNFMLDFSDIMEHGGPGGFNRIKDEAIKISPQLSTAVNDFIDFYLHYYRRRAFSNEMAKVNEKFQSVKQEWDLLNKTLFEPNGMKVSIAYGTPVLYRIKSSKMVEVGNHKIKVNNLESLTPLNRHTPLASFDGDTYSIDLAFADTVGLDSAGKRRKVGDIREMIYHEFVHAANADKNLSASQDESASYLASLSISAQPKKNLGALIETAYVPLDYSFMEAARFITDQLLDTLGYREYLNKNNLDADEPNIYSNRENRIKFIDQLKDEESIKKAAGNIYRQHFGELIDISIIDQILEKSGIVAPQAPMGQDAQAAVTAQDTARVEQAQQGIVAPSRDTSGMVKVQADKVKEKQSEGETVFVTSYPGVEYFKNLILSSQYVKQDSVITDSSEWNNVLKRYKDSPKDADAFFRFEDDSLFDGLNLYVHNHNTEALKITMAHEAVHALDMNDGFEPDKDYSALKQSYLDNSKDNNLAKRVIYALELGLKEKYRINFRPNDTLDKIEMPSTLLASEFFAYYYGSYITGTWGKWAHNLFFSELLWFFHRNMPPETRKLLLEYYKKLGLPILRDESTQPEGESRDGSGNNLPTPQQQQSALEAGRIHGPHPGGAVGYSAVTPQAAGVSAAQETRAVTQDTVRVKQEDYDKIIAKLKKIDDPASIEEGLEILKNNIQTILSSGPDEEKVALIETLIRIISSSQNQATVKKAEDIMLNNAETILSLGLYRTTVVLIETSRRIISSSQNQAAVKKAGDILETILSSGPDEAKVALRIICFSQNQSSREKATSIIVNVAIQGNFDASITLGTIAKNHPELIKSLTNEQIASLLSIYKNNIGYLKAYLKDSIGNTPEQLIMQRAKVFSLCRSLELVFEQRPEIEEPLTIKQVFTDLGTKYNFRVKQIIGWINSEEELPVITAVVNAAQKATQRARELGYGIEISPEFLCSAAIGEGFGQWLDAAYYGHSDKATFRGDICRIIGYNIWDDNSQKEIKKLKKLGFLSNNVEAHLNRHQKEIKKLKELGFSSNIVEADLITLPEVMEFMAGVLANRRMLVLEKAREILGNNTVNDMPSLEKDFWTYCYYNNPTGAIKMLYDRKNETADRFLKLATYTDNAHIFNLKQNAIRIISQEESLLRFGIFEPAEDLFKGPKSDVKQPSPPKKESKDGSGSRLESPTGSIRGPNAQDADAALAVGPGAAGVSAGQETRAVTQDTARVERTVEEITLLKAGAKQGQEDTLRQLAIVAKETHDRMIAISIAMHLKEIVVSDSAHAAQAFNTLVSLTEPGNRGYNAYAYKSTLQALEDIASSDTSYSAQAFKVLENLIKKGDTESVIALGRLSASTKANVAEQSRTMLQQLGKADFIREPSAPSTDESKPGIFVESYPGDNYFIEAIKSTAKVKQFSIITDTLQWKEILARHPTVPVWAGGIEGYDSLAAGDVIYIANFNNDTSFIRRALPHELIHILDKEVYRLAKTEKDYIDLWSTYCYGQKDEDTRMARDKLMLSLHAFLRDGYVRDTIPEVGHIATEFFAWHYSLYISGQIEQEALQSTSELGQKTEKLIKEFYKTLDVETKALLLQHYQKLGLLLLTKDAPQSGKETKGESENRLEVPAGRIHGPNMGAVFGFESASLKAKVRAELQRMLPGIDIDYWINRGGYKELERLSKLAGFESLADLINRQGLGIDFFDQRAVNAQQTALAAASSPVVSSPLSQEKVREILANLRGRIAYYLDAIVLELNKDNPDPMIISGITNLILPEISRININEVNIRIGLGKGVDDKSLIHHLLNVQTFVEQSAGDETSLEKARREFELFKALLVMLEYSSEEEALRNLKGQLEVAFGSINEELNNDKPDLVNLKWHIDTMIKTIRDETSGIALPEKEIKVGLGDGSREIDLLSHLIKLQVFMGELSANPKDKKEVFQQAHQEFEFFKAALVAFEHPEHLDFGATSSSPVRFVDITDADKGELVILRGRFQTLLGQILKLQREEYDEGSLKEASMLAQDTLNYYREHLNRENTLARVYNTFSSIDAEASKEIGREPDIGVGISTFISNSESFIAFEDPGGRAKIKKNLDESISRAIKIIEDSIDILNKVVDSKAKSFGTKELRIGETTQETLDLISLYNGALKEVLQKTNFISEALRITENMQSKIGDLPSSAQSTIEYVKEFVSLIEKTKEANELYVALVHYVNNKLGDIRIICQSLIRHPSRWDKAESKKDEDVSIINGALETMIRIMNYLSTNEQFAYDDYIRTIKIKMVHIPEEVIRGEPAATGQEGKLGASSPLKIELGDVNKILPQRLLELADKDKITVETKNFNGAQKQMLGIDESANIMATNIRLENDYGLVTSLTLIDGRQVGIDENTLIIETLRLQDPQAPAIPDRFNRTPTYRIAKTIRELMLKANLKPVNDEDYISFVQSIQEHEGYTTEDIGKLIDKLQALSGGGQLTKEHFEEALKAIVPTNFAHQFFGRVPDSLSILRYSIKKIREFAEEQGYELLKTHTYLKTGYQNIVLYRRFGFKISPEPRTEEAVRFLNGVEETLNAQGTSDLRTRAKYVADAFELAKRNNPQLPEILTLEMKLTLPDISLLVDEQVPQAVAVSSPLEKKDDKGGIDFRALPIATQPALNLQGRPAVGTVPLTRADIALTGTVPASDINLDKEWQQIQSMLKAGIVPSTERLKEYASACLGNGNADKEIDKVLSCIADILRIEEECCAPTEAALKDLLVLLESDKPAKEMPLALSNIAAIPKEPKLIGR